MLQRAIDECGGPVALASYISEHFEPISPQAVSKWKTCPPRRMYQVEAAIRANKGKVCARDLCTAVFEARSRRPSREPGGRRMVIYVRPSIEEKLRQLAERERRAVSAYCSHILEEHVALKVFRPAVGR